MSGEPRTCSTTSSYPLVVLHGALRSRVGLEPVRQYFRTRGFEAISFQYWTRRHCLEEHASRLARFIAGRFEARLPIERLGFFTHSMGALVVRRYLSLASAAEQSREQRLVMVAPPNQGSALAAGAISDSRSRVLYRMLYGKSAPALTPDAVAGLPVPPPSCRSLVLVGGRGDARGYNPRVDGDDDGVVSTSEARLPGVPLEFIGGVHSLLQWQPRVLQRAASFFASDGERSAT